MDLWGDASYYLKLQRAQACFPTVSHPATQLATQLATMDLVTPPRAEPCVTLTPVKQEPVPEEKPIRLIDEAQPGLLCCLPPKSFKPPHLHTATPLNI